MASVSAPPPSSRALAATMAGGNPMQKVSLYVGDLEPDVTEDDLFRKFSPVAPIASLRLCRCMHTGKSLRYAYLNFFSHAAASVALARLNHTELKGKPVRIMWSNRDPFPRKSGLANVFVKNLDPSVTSARLEEKFCPFGTILSCKVTEENGKSKGFGFVQFDSEESAKAAITALHDTMLEGKKLYVSQFVKRIQRTTVAEEEKFTNLYVKNLVDGIAEDHLREMFSRYGKVCSVVVMKDGKGSSRGFGFVNFQAPEDAKKALEAMNGVQLGSKNLFVGRAQKKAERTELLKHMYKDVFNCCFEKFKSSNLYVKNLNVSINEKRLKQLFGQFGKITSAKVMCYDNGMSKGFGFVCFSTPEEAMTALHRLNGTFFEGKYLYVSVAKRKEDRLLELQNYSVHTQVQSLYQPSCNALAPSFHPYYYNVPPCPSYFSTLHQASSHQQVVPNVGIRTRYPSAPTHDQRNFSYEVARHMHPGKAGIRRDCMSGQSELDHSIDGSKKVGFWKKGNRKYVLAENSSVAVTVVPSFIPATSPGNSKKNNEILTSPTKENLQPETVTKVTGVLLEKNNSDVLKLINSPNSSVAQDKPVKVPNDSNAITYASPQSARCLSY